MQHGHACLPTLFGRAQQEPMLCMCSRLDPCLILANLQPHAVHMHTQRLPVALLSGFALTLCLVTSHLHALLYMRTQIKLDMEMRGTMLLRNTADDTVWVLQTERLEQVRQLGARAHWASWLEQSHAAALNVFLQSSKCERNVPDRSLVTTRRSQVASLLLRIAEVHCSPH